MLYAASIVILIFFLARIWGDVLHFPHVKDTNVNLRLDPELKRRVDAAAELLGVNPSALMRTLLSRFVAHCEKHGGRIVMPPDFKDYEIRERNGIHDGPASVRKG
jgi:hypothetical protein